MSYTNIRIAQGDNTVDLSYVAKCTESKDYDPEYRNPIWFQLGKILDSQGNPIPLDSVVCDDGVKVTGITVEDCEGIRSVLRMIEKPSDRKDILAKIQHSQGFKEILEYVRSQ